MAYLSRYFYYPYTSHIEVPQPRLTLRKNGLDSSLFARRYWGNLGDFSSSGYLDVSIRLVSLPHAYFIQRGDYAV